MSLLITAQELSKAFGSQTLFEKISFSIQLGDRIGLVGPNGSGKSTLLKILIGDEAPDTGSIARKQGVRIGYASQSPVFEDESLENLLVRSTTDGDPHDRTTRARILLGKVGLNDSQVSAATLSGGWKKRLDIARALMPNPTLLLLDEPTNHLDLESILWLEQFLQRERISYVVISHDRYFLENVTNKIIELNRCFPQGLMITQGVLSDHFERKTAFLEAQGHQERALSNTVRDEIDWLRRSPKARTTKSQSRIQRANALIQELSEVKQRNTQKKVTLEFTASERETRKLLTAKNLSKSLGGRLLFKGVDLTLTPGSCTGIVGANGTGKTTLLKILSGEIQPDQGTIKQAEDLKLVYFDQHREKIPMNATLRRALSPLSDTVNYRGHPIHVNGWAKRFLFSADRMEMPISCLSGGERARILIARLMLEPADILFLDEPTNDLDIPTLEVIEESIQEFKGAVVLISHDRCLMDRVCTQLIGLGAGQESTHFASYAQWEASSHESKETPTSTQPSKQQPKAPTPAKKLSYKEQKELEGMDAAIQAAEAKVTMLQAQIEDYPHDSKKALELYHSLGEAQAEVEKLFMRWQDLENQTPKGG